MTFIDEKAREIAATDFNRCELRPERMQEIAEMGHRVVAGEDRYNAVSLALGVPWYVVGVIHQMEAGGSFERHLHNGDPLTARTVHVPKGRPLAEPKLGLLPYTWEESACDALQDYPPKPKKWDLGSVLVYLEAYNGFGYRHHGCVSPYVWSATTAYVQGKFVADGAFDMNAVSDQIGCAAILKILGVWRVVDLA